MKFLVPEQLETERLLLRLFQGDDWAALHTYYSDEVATKFTIGRALTEGESWRATAMMIGHWYVRGYGPYAVEEKKSNTVVGTVGFWYPNDWPEPEIKWGLSRSYWRQGFAKEAAFAVHDAGRRHMPEVHLISLIDMKNEASIGVAMAMGASLESKIEFKGQLHGIYRHRKDE